MAKFDFSGIATANDQLCADGVTIKKGAFSDQNGEIVPLVLNHDHKNPDNWVGHAVLVEEPHGIRAYGKFDSSPLAQKLKQKVAEGTVRYLSIFANGLTKRGSNVVHGTIREVSLVLSGANPGAVIDVPYIAHSVDADDFEGVIYTGEEITGECELKHSNYETEDYGMARTAEEIYEDMSEEQQAAVQELLGNVLMSQDDEYYEEDDDEYYEDEDDEYYEDDDDEYYEDDDDEYYEEDDDEYYEDDEFMEDDEMKHNVFDVDYNNDVYLAHDGLDMILADAENIGNLRDSFIAHAAEYGIDNIDYLMPEYQQLENIPPFIKTMPDEWIGIVMNGVRHTPFSKVKMVFADITGEEARAKGYFKGKYKKEEVFQLLKRVVDGQMVYKKQRMDREDVIDITSFDVVAWIKGEMRLKLDEELARAFLFGDGRNAMSEDKIKEDKIIPIAADADFYSLKHTIEVLENQNEDEAFIDACVASQDDYEGSGNTTLFVSNKTVTKCLLLKDKMGRRLYKDITDLASACSVNKIVKVPASIVPEGIKGIIVDLKDYNVGADKGGAINMFDDFNFDYNQYQYLIETKCSGALVKPKSAVVLKTA